MPASRQLIPIRRSHVHFGLLPRCTRNTAMCGDRAQCCVSGFSMNLTRTVSVARLPAKRLRSTCSVRPAHGSRPHAGSSRCASHTTDQWSARHSIACCSMGMASLSDGGDHPSAALPHTPDASRPRGTDQKALAGGRRNPWEGRHRVAVLGSRHAGILEVLPRDAPAS